MHRLSFVVFILVLLLFASSCQSSQYLLDTRFDTEEFLEDYDVSMDYTASQGMLTRAGDVYYASMGNLAVYHDIQTGVTGALCGKADCAHDSMNCNAFLDLGGANIQVYDGKLYWLQMNPTGWSLYRMGLDGSGRERVQDMTDPESYDLQFAIHRGYVYTMTIKSDVSGGSSSRILEIKQYVLGAQEEEPYTIYTQAYDGSLQYVYALYRNKLYMAVDNDKNFEGRSYDRELFEYDVAAREWKLLWSDTLPWTAMAMVVDAAGADILETQSTEAYKIQKSRIIFSTGQREEMGEISTIEGVSADSRQSVFMSEEYIVIYTCAYPGADPRSQDVYRCRVLDKSTCEVLAEHEMSGEYVYCIGSDENGILFNQESWEAEHLSDTEDLTAYKILLVPSVQNQEPYYPMEYDEVLSIGKSTWQAIFP